MTQREEINVIYEEYAKTDGLMSAADLLNFLLNEQREDASLNDAFQLIEKYELDENGNAACLCYSYKLLWIKTSAINTVIQKFAVRKFSLGLRGKDIQAQSFFNCMSVFRVSCSQSQTANDKGWLPNVPAPAGGVDL